MIERHICRIGGINLHYRESAKQGGVPLVLLHPSPRNSAMFEPLIDLLRNDFHVVAPDTPGYGESDHLPSAPTEISGYVPSLQALLHAVIGPRFMLYGSATGAQLAISYANTHPLDVEHLFLDNAAHFKKEERNRIKANYFPDLVPCKNGSHLVRAWQMSEQMIQFFPWFENNEAHRISDRAPSATEIHTLAMEFLAAGAHYDRAYRAAFDHEKAENIQALAVPTTVFRWKGSVLLKYIDQLLSLPLPPNVHVVDTPLAMSERYATMLARFNAVKGLDRKAPDFDLPQPPQKR